ncbi:MAG: proline dehydrogenase family protein [Bacteroidota bacterium]
MPDNEKIYSNTSNIDNQAKAPDISFDNLELTFSGKDDKELQNTYFVFKLISNPFITLIFSKLTLLALKIYLPVNWLIKATVFRQFCAGETLEECSGIINKLGREGIGCTLDYCVESKSTEKDFEKTKTEILKMIDFAKVNAHVYSVSLKPTSIARYELLEKVSNKEELTQKEQLEFENIRSRLDEICSNASRSDLPVLIDAEKSQTQNAIDDLCRAMMEKYNSKKPIVFITLQMYRWDRLHFLDKLLEDSKTKNFILGVKFVRGAYWEKEIKRGEELKCRPVVYMKKEETDDAYNNAVAICLENLNRTAICAATHNEESSMILASGMKNLNIKPDHPNIEFSQLYGMSDHISYNLTKGGHNVTKYLPYGPIKYVIPYLIRRAEENKGIEGQMGKELKMIIKERERRKGVKSVCL